MEQSDKQEAPVKEFKNEAVTVTARLRPRCIMEYKVIASPKIVKTAHQKAVKAITKEVSLPGFRKGKAPDYLVLKNYSGQINKQWEEAIAEVAFRESQALAQVPLINNKEKVSFQIQSHSLENGAELTLTFETEPVIPNIDPKQITLKAAVRPEVNEDKVQETIRQVQLFFSEWKKIEDRPVKEGDFVLLDVDIIEDTPPTSLFSNTRFEVVDKSMAQWMKKLVIGLKTGDSAEGVSIPDEGATEEEKKEFPPKKVRLHLKAIEEPVMPPVDDAFAKQLGVPTLAELPAAISSLLNKQADAHVQEKLREQLGNFLITHFSFDLPASLIENETQLRLRQLFQDSDFQRYWEQVPIEERKKMIETLYQQSEKAVRMFYLCRKILADGHIAITPEDVSRGPTTPLEALILPPSGLQQHQNPEIRRAEVVSKLMLEKAEDYLITHANIE